MSRAELNHPQPLLDKEGGMTPILFFFFYFARSVLLLFLPSDEPTTEGSAKLNVMEAGLIVIPAKAGIHLSSCQSQIGFRLAPE